MVQKRDQERRIARSRTKDRQETLRCTSFGIYVMEGVLAWSEFHLVDPFDAILVFFFAIIRPRAAASLSKAHSITMRTTRFCMCMGVAKQKSSLHYENDYQSLTRWADVLLICPPCRGHPTLLLRMLAKAWSIGCSIFDMQYYSTGVMSSIFFFNCSPRMQRWYIFAFWEIWMPLSYQNI